MQDCAEKASMDAVLFDIDDTLYDQAVPFMQAVRSAFPGLGELDGEALFQARAHHGEISFHKVLAGEMTMEEMYRYRIREALREFDVSVTDEEADTFQQLYGETQKQLEMSHTMEAVLALLQERGVILGIITNGPAGHQREKAEVLGMGNFVRPEHIFVSGEVGYTKPDLRIFRRAEETMGLMPQNTWYVGDSYENDMVGAARAGWHTVWMNRRGKEVPVGAEVRPERIVSSDEELLEMMRRE